MSANKKQSKSRSRSKSKSSKAWADQSSSLSSLSSTEKEFMKNYVTIRNNQHLKNKETTCVITSSPKGYNNAKGIVCVSRGNARKRIVCNKTGCKNIKRNIHSRGPGKKKIAKVTSVKQIPHSKPKPTTTTKKNRRRRPRPKKTGAKKKNDESTKAKATTAKKSTKGKATTAKKPKRRRRKRGRGGREKEKQEKSPSK